MCMSWPQHWTHEAHELLVHQLQWLGAYTKWCVSNIQWLAVVCPPSHITPSVTRQNQVAYMAFILLTIHGASLSVCSSNWLWVLMAHSGYIKWRVALVLSTDAAIHTNKNGAATFNWNFNHILNKWSETNSNIKWISAHTWRFLNHGCKTWTLTSTAGFW